MVKGIWQAAIVASGLASIGCSGSSSSDGDGGDTDDPALTEVCAEYPGPPNGDDLVDDLEDGDAQIATVAGRTASWWVSSDETAGGTLNPVANAAPLPERIPGARCESEYAMRLTGEGFTSWGAALITSLDYDVGTETLQPIDASGYQGLMFWARVGDLHNSSVRVQFQDPNTDALGGVCNPVPGSPDECYNGWGTALLPIDTDWRLYRVPFRNLGQRDFGYRPDAFNPSAVYSIEWNLDANSVFDLWIDDVWFY